MASDSKKSLDRFGNKYGTREAAVSAILTEKWQTYKDIMKIARSIKGEFRNHLDGLEITKKVAKRKNNDGTVSYKVRHTPGSK
jgi:pterin-4a-carbinolamine dehydratase